jgi:hypothetical protein
MMDQQEPLKGPWSSWKTPAKACPPNWRSFWNFSADAEGQCGYAFLDRENSGEFETLYFLITGHNGRRRHQFLGLFSLVLCGIPSFACGLPLTGDGFPCQTSRLLTIRHEVRSAAMWNPKGQAACGEPVK